MIKFFKKFLASLSKYDRKKYKECVFAQYEYRNWNIWSLRWCMKLVLFFLNWKAIRSTMVTIISFKAATSVVSVSKSPLGAYRLSFGVGFHRRQVNTVCFFPNHYPVFPISLSIISIGILLRVSIFAIPIERKTWLSFFSYHRNFSDW